MRIEPVTLANAHPACLNSAFWEAGPDVPDVRMAKELWLNSTLLTFGICGFSIPDTATILFAPPSLLPGAALMPSGPASPDATLISSLFSGVFAEGATAVLIDACLAHLVAADAPAVECFGWRSGSTFGPIGLIPESALVESGFQLVADHDEVPRYRMELPPVDGLLAAAEIEELPRVGVCS